MTFNLVSTERSCHKVDTHVKYEGLKSYQEKDMANVKVFADKESNRRAKNYKPPAPPSIDAGA